MDTSRQAEDPGTEEGHGDSEGPWYRRWFGEEYLELYPHRDRREARSAVNLLLATLDGETPGPILDLGCGAGRHLAAFRDHGVRVVGLDLSPVLLARARATASGVALARGDMRALPFRDGSFAAVASFFTSFGYFEAEDHDRHVLAEGRRVLRDEGHFMLDFLNAEAVTRTLVPRDERLVGQRRVIQERQLIREGRFVEKRIRIEPRSGGGRPREFVERVRLYTQTELETLLEASGFSVTSRMGDYEGRPAHSDAPRVILLARKAGRG